MRRCLPWLLLLYATLDFANPLMPGAVGFAGGSVEVVPADRLPRSGASALPGPAVWVLPDAVVPSVAAALARPTMTRPAPRPPRHDARRAAPARRHDFRPLSPSDDH